MSLFYEPNKAKLYRLVEDATLSSGAIIPIQNGQISLISQNSQWG